MKEVKIKLKVDDTEAVKATKGIEKGIKDIGEEAEKTDKEVEAIGVTAGGTKTGFNIMAKAISRVGLALKAAGIGLVIAIIAGLTEAFSRNKQVMDSLSIALETIQGFFSQITDALVATYNAVAQSSDNFDALGKVVNSLITMSLYPLELTFYTLLQASNALQLGYEKIFGDEEGVKKAQDNLDKTTLKITMLNLEVTKAGKDLVNNFSEAVSEVGNIANITSESFSKVSIKTAKESAKAYKAAKDAAILAQAESAALRAGYELEAAELKKIRDNVNLSLEERIKANDDLAKTSALAEEQMKRQAQLAINLAALEVKRNDSIENQAALIQSNADLKAVEAEIAGKTEEVETNRVGLLNEQNALLLTGIESQRERNKIQAEFDAEQEIDPLVKLEKQKSALELENTAIIEDLEAKRLLYAEGTQQRVDAEQDYLNKKQGIDNQLVANTKATNDQIKANDQATADAKKAIQDATFNTISGGLNLLKQLGEESKAMQAAVLIGESAVGISKMVIGKTTADLADTAYAATLGPAGPAYLTTKKLLNKVNLGIGIATNVAATAKGLAALGEGGAPAGGDAGGAGGGAEAPAFNSVEGTESNAIQDSITGQDNAVKAIVISGDVTTAQSADRNAVDSSGF
jgi:hypothetical protein